MNQNILVVIKDTNENLIWRCNHRSLDNAMKAVKKIRSIHYPTRGYVVELLPYDIRNEKFYFNDIK